MTIRNIRKLQIACLALLIASALLLLYAVLLIRIDSHRFADVSAFLSVGCLTSGLVLLLIIRKLRCPVCRSVFVGRRSPRYFTRACSNCGRRSGDTA